MIENYQHPAYLRLQEVGEEITKKVQPKAILIVSAHWQGYPDRVKINVAERPDQIYDFYGFPPHFYQYKYPHTGSSVIADHVIEKLSAARIDVERVDRGLDHGAWVGLMIGVSASD